MMWWFVILAFSTGAVLWAGVALYIRVRRHLVVEREVLEDSEGRRTTEPL
jgi:putative exporter of polyketide antibiotics